MHQLSFGITTFGIKTRDIFQHNLVITLLIIASAHLLYAQTEQIDIEAIQKKGSSLIDKRLYEEAYSTLNKAGLLLAPHQNSLKIRNDLLLSKLFMYQQEAEAAIQYGKSAYDLASRLHLDTLILQSNLAIGEAIYYAEGNAYSAIYYFEEAERALNSYPYTVEIKYRTYYNLLVCNRAMGKIDNALQYGALLEDLINTQSGELSSPAIASCYFVIGNNYREMYSTKALYYFLKADSIMEAKSGPANYYQLNYYYPQMAIYYNQKRDHEKALHYLKEIDLRSPQSYQTNRQNIINQAWTYLQLKDYHTADSLALASLPLAKKLTDSVFTYKTLGKTALDNGDPVNALNWFNIALGTLYPDQINGHLPEENELVDPYNEPDIYGYMGNSYLLLAQKDKDPRWLNDAHKYLWFGLKTALLNRPSVKHHNAQITLSRHIKPIYSWVLDYYHHQYLQESSLAYIDTAAMLINHAKATIIKSKSRLFQSYQIPDSLKVARSQVVLRINELQQKAGSADSIFHYFSYLERIDNEIGKIQDIYEAPVFHELPEIDSESLSINYLWGEDALYAVTDGKEKRFIKVSDMGKLDTLTQTYYSLVKQPEYENFNAFQHAGAMLFHSILSPLLTDDLPKHIVVVPDEKLLLIPFEALPVTDKGTNYFNADYLVRHMDVAYTSYLEVNQQNTSKEINKSAISFAYNYKRETHFPGYLKNVEQESAVFNSILGGNTFTGVEATESNYKAIATSRMQHLAMHGKASEDIPYIRFRNEKDANNDGKLYEYEIYNTQIPAELVILTACESNMGEIASSEGSISLSRAFMGAGTNTVISSLWTLNDEASLALLEPFLRNYQNSKDPLSALSKAKRSYLKNADELVAHPYFWAGLVGNTSLSVVHEDSYKMTYFAIILLLCTLILYFGYRYYQRCL